MQQPGGAGSSSDRVTTTTTTTSPGCDAGSGAQPVLTSLGGGGGSADTIDPVNSMPLHIPQLDVAFPSSSANPINSNNDLVVPSHHRAAQKNCGTWAPITGEPINNHMISNTATQTTPQQQQQQYVTTDYRRKTSENDIITSSELEQHRFNSNNKRSHEDSIAATTATTTMTTSLGGHDDAVEQCNHAAYMNAYFPSLTAMTTNVAGHGLLSTASFPLPASNSVSLPSLFPACVGQHGDMYQYQGSGHYLVEDNGEATTSGGSVSTTTNNYSGSAGSGGGVCGGGGINMGVVDSAPFNQDVIESTFRMVGDLGTAGVTDES